MKQKNKIKILITLLMASYNVQVNAANSWNTSADFKGHSYGIKGMDINVGGGSIFTLSNSATGEILDEAYCIDPSMDNPNGRKYIKEGSFNLQEEYTEICNMTDLTQKEKIDVFKAYAFLNDDIGTIKYKDTYRVFDYLYNGNTSTKDGYTVDATTVTGADYATKIKTIADGVSGSTVNAVPTLEGNNDGSIANYVLKTNGYKGELIIETDGKFNGQTINDGKYIINDFEGETKIRIEPNDECLNGNKTSYKIVFKYETNGINGGKIAQLFTSADGGTQDLIACVPSGGDTNGSIVKEGELSCSGKNCTPEVNVGSLSDGAAICDANGTTIVDIYEIPDESDILACVGDGYDELGNSVDVSAQLLDNAKYCSIYCYEDYSLTLPGPDAASPDNPADTDDSMFTNAGSYFTIDGELSSKNTVKCVTIKNVDAYKQDILDERKRIVDAYNTYSRAEAAAKTTCEEKSDPIYDEEGNVTGYNKYLKVTIPSRKEMSMNGDSYKTITISGGVTNVPGTSCAGYAETSSAEEKIELDKVVGEATRNITEYKTAWDSCDTWELDNLVSSCGADITFEYHDGEKFGNPVIEPITPPITTDSYGTLGDSQKTSVKDKVCTTAPNCDGANSSSEVIISGRTGSVTISGKYQFKNEFVIHAETGDVYWGDSDQAKECVANNECYESKGFPVSIDTTQGKYYYQYTFKDLGHYFSDGTCGRLDEFVKKYGSDDAGMKCYYDVNNCEDCDVTCSGDGCDLMIPDCNGNGCKVACVGGGCILDINSGFLATFRTISLNDEEFATIALLAASPNNLLAYNSAKNKRLQNESNWQTDKGIYTAGIISDIGENIYSNDPEYSIKLTPQIINEIKGYNDEEGNYLNDTLECKVSDKYGKCTSKFVDIFVERKDNKATFESYGNNPGANEPFIGPAWK